jgi:hypothetical protein
MGATNRRTPRMDAEPGTLTRQAGAMDPILHAGRLSRRAGGLLPWTVNEVVGGAVNALQTRNTPPLNSG